jgi:hypothetical protein
MACHSNSTQPLGIARGLARITVRWQPWSPWPGPGLPESGQSGTQGGMIGQGDVVLETPLSRYRLHGKMLPWRLGGT